MKRAPGKRVSRPPDFYNPTVYPVNLPPSDFDLTMSEAGDDSILDESQAKVPEEGSMLQIMLQQFGQVNKQLSDNKTRLNDLQNTFTDRYETLEHKLDEKLAEVQSNFNDIRQQLISLNDSILAESQAYTDQKIREVRLGVKNDCTQISNRLYLVEGQAARLAALENAVQTLQLSNTNNSESHSFNILQESSNTTTDQVPRHNFGPKMSSTVLPGNIENTSVSSNNIPVNVSSVSTLPQFSGLNQSSLIQHKKLEKVVPEFNGDIKSLHPEDFLMHLDNYFQSHNLSDQNKLYDVRIRLVGEASLWFRTLIPVPNTYQSFVEQFRKYFWSETQQTKIMNEIYKPYYHRDTSTLRKHAMEWIIKSQHLQPPIAESVMVRLITNHFPESIASSIRIQNIKTLNNLQEVLSQLEYTPRSSNVTNNTNNSNNSNNNPAQNALNTNRNRNNHNEQNNDNTNQRYFGQNNYNRNNINNYRGNFVPNYRPRGNRSNTNSHNEHGTHNNEGPSDLENTENDRGVAQ